jgi:hypothetical protein
MRDASARFEPANVVVRPATGWVASASGEVTSSCSASIRMTPAEHREFRKLIEHRLQREIQYSSRYGERFTAEYGHAPA